MITQPATQTDLSTAIQTAASRIAAKHPHLADMVNRAAEIAENGCIEQTATNEHRVLSTSGETYWITRMAGGEMLCSCPAFTYRPVKVGQSHYCKHIMAHVIRERAEKDAAEYEQYLHDCGRQDYEEAMQEMEAARG